MISAHQSFRCKLTNKLSVLFSWIRLLVSAIQPLQLLVEQLLLLLTPVQVPQRRTNQRPTLQPRVRARCQ